MFRRFFAADYSGVDEYKKQLAAETETVYIEVQCKRIALTPGMTYDF